MSQLHPNADDDAFAQMHTDAGFKKRVENIKKLHTELKRLALKYPDEQPAIQKVLDETKEWL